MNMEQTETEDSDTDSSSDETTFAIEIETNPTSSLPTLSQELELLKNLLKLELDESLETKLKTQLNPCRQV